MVGRHPLFGDLCYFWGERVGVVFVMQPRGVLQVYLEDEASLPVWPPTLDLLLGQHIAQPGEVADWEILAHGPAVEVVCVDVVDVGGLFLGVVVLEIGIVCLAVALHLG